MIPFIKPILGEQEVDAVARVIRSGIIAQGPEVAAFEKEFAELCGVRHAVAVNSGTAALHALMSACGIGPGDEVITTPFTFIATASAIRMCGATPVFADIDGTSYNLDAASVRAAITPRTRAILAVHLYGLPCDMDSLAAVAKENDLVLLEDACQAVGASWRGRRAGGLGLGAAFSTYATKNLSTGEGGLVTTDDDQVADFVRRFRHHGQPPGGRYVYSHLGYNYRMTDIAAAIGRCQLTQIEAWNARRRDIAKRYNDALDRLPGVTVPASPPDAEHVFHLYTLRVSGDRQRFSEALAAGGVSSGVYYPIPLYRTGIFGDAWRAEDFPRCEAAAAQVLSIPCHPALSDHDVDQVIAVVLRASEVLR